MCQKQFRPISALPLLDYFPVGRGSLFRFGNTSADISYKATLQHPQKPHILRRRFPGPTMAEKPNEDRSTPK
jgi:hypothetical protein